MTAATTARAPDPATVMAQARTENFPVASLILPRRVRSHLLAVYGFARLVDDVGDEAAGDRMALLDELEADLEQVWTGTPQNPLIQRLQPTVEACALPIDPFRGLIDANRRDQIVHRYETFDDLLGYCALSASTIGELVLRIFELATPERLELSDKICSALQLTEHWQDIAEDYANGRIYVPLEDMRRFDVAEDELGASAASQRVRELTAFEVERTRRLLSEGAPLARALPRRYGFAVAGFAAGGRSALKAIERADCDVLSPHKRAGWTRRTIDIIDTVVRRAA